LPEEAKALSPHQPKAPGTPNELKFYSFGQKIPDSDSERNFGPASEFSHISRVGRPSESAKITSFRLAGGGLSHRVTVSIGHCQRKRETTSFEEAQAIQQIWELERVQSHASLRPKITALTHDQLREAEAAQMILRGSGLSLLQAAQHTLQNRPAAGQNKDLALAVDEFLTARKQFVSAKQFENYKLAGTRFSESVGKVGLQDVSAEAANKWLKNLGISPKTWNTYRNDLSAIFNWFILQKWIATNPIKDVERFSRRRVGYNIPHRLQIADCQAIMAEVEKLFPEWVVYFALTLIGGIRACVKKGEIAKLARVVKRDGVEKYFHDQIVDIPAEVAKTGAPRQRHLPENLRAWLSKYPVSSDTICPVERRREYYTEVRPHFSLQHNDLRHTAISAHVAHHGEIGLTALEFGTSESEIKHCYLNRMSKDEAEAFYSIFPSCN
jgi:hypothetical protein